MSLKDFNFTDDTNWLRCRKCNAIITKTHGATLLGTKVKWGICKKTSHGATITKV